jgi:hypothetical protein
MRQRLHDLMDRNFSPATMARLRLVQHVIYITRERHVFHERECCICGFHGFFAPVGLPIRHEGSCPQCRSSERHRLFRLWFAGNRGAIAGRRVLHFAPERCVRSFVEPEAGEYLSADIRPGRGDLVVDIERLGLAGGSVDAIICLHVLEHVDDGAALAELHRVLAPGGVLFLMMPVIEGWDRTYENAAVVTDEHRELHFGQWDHVRYFGADIRDRVRGAGFRLTEWTAVEPEVSRYSLIRGEKLFIAFR